jgi:hypothetical protein
MKTFKLKALEIVEQEDEEIIQNKIKLKDGLIINREDEQNQWVIEAYIEKSYLSFFKALQADAHEVLLQAKITKESNNYATFITSLIGLNEIGENINVLFQGTIVDRQKHKIEEMLTNLIEAGYQGNELLEKFKALT